MNTLCPCHSQIPYQDCCKPWHEGALPKTALQLMRSRYAAYSLKLVDYIIQTTHPSNALFLKSEQEIKQGILDFSSHTRFAGLQILDFQDGENEAFVTFRALLFHGKQDISFEEKSRFLRVDGKWLYVDAVSLSH